MILHPTLRGELLIGGAVFLIGAAVGVLVEAVDAIADARDAEREQLQGAGRLLDDVERELVTHKRNADEWLAAAGGAMRAHNALAAAIVEHRETAGAVVREHDRKLYAAATPDVVRQAIVAADDGELVRDALARTRCACESGHGVCYCHDDELVREPEREQDGAGGPGEAA